MVMRGVVGGGGCLWNSRAVLFAESVFDTYETSLAGHNYEITNRMSRVMGVHPLLL